VAPVGPVGPVGPKSSSTITKVPFNGTCNGKNTVAVLILTRDKVTGATDTFTIPTPKTSPVLIGEFPSKKSPCEEDSAKAAPFVD
jgi:hypothetical protein